MLKQKSLLKIQILILFKNSTAEIEGTPLHTLNKKELKNYPGASLNADYDRQKDGKKWQSLVKSLQEN